MSKQCDIPIHTVEESIKFIFNELKPDFMLWYYIYFKDWGLLIS